MKKYESNPFTLSFGNEPTEYISRIAEKDQLIRNISAEPPLSHYHVITGIRGSGKTVLLTTLSAHFEKEADYIVIELNPEDDMREALAAKLYSKCLIKRLFLEKNFSFSFSGISFSITGKNPVFNIDDLLDKMFAELTRQSKKVLVLIDEASNNAFLKQFALSVQILIRKNYGLFVVMTALYDNISAIENEKNLTFLVRAPRVYLTNLNMTSIVNSYQESLLVDETKARQFAKLTKGYAFAFQLLGYLLFEATEKELSAPLLSQFDQYLEEYVYNKVWLGLSTVEKQILRAIETDDTVQVGAIIEKLGMRKEYFSQYRDRLVKKGILAVPGWGQLAFALPRFKNFIDSRF